MMVVDISDPHDPELVAEPIDAAPGESSRELRVWQSQGVLIVLNTNCGVGDALHHCTAPSVSNVRFYDIAGRRDAKHAAAAERVQRRHARVLPLGGPEKPEAGADLRRQRRLDVRDPRWRAELPVLGLGHLADP